MKRKAATPIRRAPIKYIDDSDDEIAEDNAQEDQQETDTGSESSSDANPDVEGSSDAGSQEDREAGKGQNEKNVVATKQQVTKNQGYAAAKLGLQQSRVPAARGRPPIVPQRIQGTQGQNLIRIQFPSRSQIMKSNTAAQGTPIGALVTQRLSLGSSGSTLPMLPPSTAALSARMQVQAQAGSTLRMPFKVRALLDCRPYPLMARS
jgi:hypothetical protein